MNRFYEEIENLVLSCVYLYIFLIYYVSSIMHGAQNLYTIKESSLFVYTLVQGSFAANSTSLSEMQRQKRLWLERGRKRKEKD